MRWLHQEALVVTSRCIGSCFWKAGSGWFLSKVKKDWLLANVKCFMKHACILPFQRDRQQNQLKQKQGNERHRGYLRSGGSRDRWRQSELKRLKMLRPDYAPDCPVSMPDSRAVLCRPEATTGADR
jgi:hypothetical protein